MANMSFQERKKAMKDYTESLRKQSEEKKKKEKEKKSTTELNLPSREQYERAKKYAGMSFDEKRAAMKQESQQNYARAQGQKMPNTAYSGARGVALGTDTMLNNLQVQNTAYSGARGVAMGTDTMLRGLSKAGRAGVKGVIDNVNEMKMPTYGRPGARGVALGTDTMLRNMPNMGVNGARGVGASVDALARGNRQQAEQPAATAQGEQPQQYGPRASFGQMMEQYAKNTQKYAGQTKDSATSFSAWVNSLGGNYKPGELNVTPENVMAYLDEVEKDRQRGAYNQSSDSSLWSTGKKEQEAGRLRTEGEAWQQWHDENAPKTAEEEKARNATIWANDTHPGQWLDVDGLDVGLDQKVNRRPDDYYEGNMREDYDQRMYDAMYGEGAYYDLLESDATVDEIELELDRMWDRLEKGEMHLYDEEDTAKNKAKQEALDLAPNAKNQKLSRAEELEEDARRERLLQQMAESAPAAEPFDESMNPGHYENWGGEKDVFVAGGDKADNAFYNINNTWEDQQRQKGLVAPDGTVLGERPYWSEWKDEWFVSHTPMSNYGGRSEADIFNGYYRNGQKDEALAFLQALKDSGVLAERKAKAAEIEQRERARLKVGGVDVGWITGAGATLVKPIGDVMGSVDVIGSLLGVEGSGDPNSVWHKLSSMTSNIRDERGNIWDEAAVAWFGPEAAGWGKKFNGALYSILDNVVAMGAGQLGTAGIADPEQALKATTAAVQWIMSTGAAESTFSEKVKNGMKPDEAAIYAIGDGIIEAITEKYSIEALLNADVKQMLGSGKGVWAFLGKNFLAEGSEEVASDVLSMALDDVMSAINGHESEFRARISELVNVYGLPEDEAKKQAMRETWQKFGESFGFGGLSGLIMSGSRVAINAGSNWQAGRKIKGVNSILKNSGTRQLIEQGLQMGEGSQSAELASVMKQELDEGWNVSSRRMGQLAQNIQLESQEQAQASVKETIEKNAQELLEKGGENEDAVEELAPIVSKMITEGEQALTKDEKTALLDSPVAMQAVEDMTAGGELTQKINNEISKATEGVRNRVVVSRNLMEGRTAEGLNPKSVGEQLATENDIRRADGARVEGSGEVIYDGQFGKVTGLEQVTGEDGKTSWQVKVEQNGETKYADPAEVKATNFTTAAILRQRAVNPQFYGGNYTNTLLQQAQGSNVQNVGQYLQDAYKIRWAAYLGQQMPQTEISTKAAEELYLESRKDAAQEWQEAQQERQANFRGQGQGKVTFKGAEYGSEAFTEAVKDLDQQQRDRIDMVANIAQASGIELDFVDASDPEYRANIHGFENGKGITINLDSYDNRQAKEEGRKHHIIATMSHEMTHWLQRNNAQGYLQLQDFVLQKMADEGVNVAARAEDLMAQRGIGMTKAIDEIVANACDQVLGNQQLAKELEQNNKGLYNSIKNFVRNIVNKIKSAVFGMEDSASLDAKRMMYRYGNELAKIWLGAYDDVISGKIAEIDAQEMLDKAFDNPVVKFSMAEPIEVNKDGLIAVHNLSADQLMKTIKLGGFPMPSIAIVKSDYAHNRYGDTSVVFYPGTIDPKASRSNKVYGGDAWTPTYPSLEYKLSEKKINNALKKVNKLVPENLNGDRVELYTDNLQNAVRSTGDIVSAVKRILRLKVAYLKEKGIDIDMPTKEKDLVHGATTNKQIKAVVERLGKDEIMKTRRAYENGERFDDGMVDQIIDVFNDVWVDELRNKLSDEEISKLKGMAYSKEKWGYGKTDEVILGAYRYLTEGVQSEIDERALEEKIDKKIDQTDYENWLRELFDGAIEKSGLRNNKNYYTDSGNPRSWEALHDEETLDNVVRIMKEEEDKASNAFFSQSAMLAIGTRNFKSMKDIKAHQDQLQHISDEEMSAAKQNIVNKFGQLMDELADPKERNVFIARDRALQAMVDAVKTSRTVSGITSAMKQWGYTLSEDQAKTIIGLMEEIANLPTEYFEAKPKRAVGLNEIAKVVLPADADQKLFDALKQNSIDYETYDGTDEDRLKKVNSTEKARFSIADDSNMEVASWMEHVSPWSLQTEGERQLVADYRGKRVALQLSIHRQGEYSKQIAALEAKGELDYAERQKLAELRNKLDVQEGKQARLLNELYQITGSEGYAGMMYRNQKLLDDYVQGKTVEQVTDTIGQLMQETEQADKIIKRRQGEIERMAENGPVKAVISALKNRGLLRTVQALQNEYATAMEKDELNGRLGEIILKKVNGEDITEDIRDLASDVVNNQQSRMAEDANDAMKQIRGMTVVIGPEQQTELKATNSSLAEIRQRTKGSGVKFKYGDHSTLDSNWQEISEEIVSMRDKLDNAKNSLGDFVDYIEGLLKSRVSDKNEYGVDTQEVEAFLQASVNIVLDGQTGGLTPEKLKKKILKREGAMDKALASMNVVTETMDKIMASARKADGFAGFLHNDVQAAIDYYNKVAKQAAEVERNNVRKNVIEVLRNEHTKALIEQQQKYMDMMKNDRKAREIHQDNEVLRNKVNTELKRFKTLLTAETDKKNIQEEAKPLARYIAGMLADHDRVGLRRVSHISQKDLDEFSYKLSKQQAADGEFDAERDLDWLVVKAPNPEDNDYSMRDKAMQDLEDIRKGLQEYQLAERTGPDDKRTGVDILQERKNALLKVQEATEELSEIIRARSTAFINGQRRDVMDLAKKMQADANKSRFKGERTGRRGIAKERVGEFVGYGNLTPEYFIKMLRNDTMNLMLDGFHEAENESGLQALAAKKRVEKIVKDTGADKWDGQEIHKVKVSGGRQVDMTTEQVMSLYATWLREQNAMRPEDTAHLLHGGFVLGMKNRAEMKNGRIQIEQKPIRMTKEMLDGLEDLLTPEQVRYVDDIVEYMSRDLAELGNKTSLQTYGIKKFTEQYYFPIKAWGGVLNKSSTAGVNNKNDNAAMRQSFSKRVQANAQNAIEIGDFTATAMKHIVGMIRFNTVGPAVENLNKVLNQQLEYGDKQYGDDGEVIEDNTYKRNMRAVFQEKYGKGAANYLSRWMEDINGGVTAAKDDSIYGKLLSVFRKGAVAGSVSVAAQQPLSYIRAAMMVNPKYLAAAAAPWNWSKVHEEMTKYSGVAVIKDMGKFDMNQGRSMIDFISPEQKKGGLKAAGEKITEWSTKAPEIMDQVTWGRMWVACKLETAARNKGMDQKSDEFMKKVALRFNDLMRKTQVYDSVMVRSQHMRSPNVASKMMTSFMAEPTLTLNVLADAVQNVDEAGGKARLAKAAVTFMMSAAAQAAVKSIMGAGRNPDEKKRLEEQFEIKFIQNFLSEINPMNLIPGAGEIVEALMKGEVSNDAMSVLGKLKTISDAVEKWRKGDISDYRGVEDTAGQVTQIFTGVPAKNIMRDLRAMYNFFAPGKFASREHSNAVVKYGAIDAVLGGTNVAGLANQILQNNGLGYGTDANDYVERIYNAGKKGDKEAEQELTEYYLLGKSKADDPQKALNQALNRMLKDDRDLSAEEMIEALDDGGYGKMGEYIMEQYKDGKIDRKTAEKYYRQENPKSSDKDVLKALDRVEWEMSGKPLASGQKNYTNYTPLYVGIENNKAAEIQDAVDYMIDHGYEAKSIKSELGKAGGPIRELYMSTTDKDQRRRLRNALQIAYKRLGYTAEDADKTIEKWTKDE